MNDSLPCLLKPDETKQLTALIETTLKHFEACYSYCEPSYLEALQLISDCYQLVLLETHESTLAYHFSLHFHSLSQVAPYVSHISTMIQTVAYQSRIRDFPWFYPQFFNAVSYLLSDKFTYLSLDSAWAERLLEKMRHLHQRRLS